MIGYAQASHVLSLIIGLVLTYISPRLHFIYLHSRSTEFTAVIFVAFTQVPQTSVMSPFTATSKCIAFSFGLATTTSDSYCYTSQSYF